MSLMAELTQHGSRVENQIPDDKRQGSLVHILSAACKYRTISTMNPHHVLMPAEEEMGYSAKNEDGIPRALTARIDKTSKLTTALVGQRELRTTSRCPEPRYPRRARRRRRVEQGEI